MYGRPIHGQLEVKGDGSAGYNTLWKTAEGVFVKPTEDDASTNKKTHDAGEF
jgi:hypothetical protein